MSYATTNQWSTRGDHLDDDLVAAGVSVQDLLDESSREMDRYMGRRSLEPKLVTNHDVVVAGNRPSLRHVRIDDHPVHQSEDWFFSLSGAQLFDRTFTAQTAMATSDVTIRVAELSGQLYLPEPAYDGWTLRLSYSCGYGTNVSTPSIPTICWKLACCGANRKCCTGSGRGTLRRSRLLGCGAAWRKRNLPPGCSRRSHD